MHLLHIAIIIGILLAIYGTVLAVLFKIMSFLPKKWQDRIMDWFVSKHRGKIKWK